MLVAIRRPWEVHNIHSYDLKWTIHRYGMQWWAMESSSSCGYGTLWETSRIFPSICVHVLPPPVTHQCLEQSIPRKVTSPPRTMGLLQYLLSQVTWYHHSFLVFPLGVYVVQDLIHQCDKRLLSSNLGSSLRI